MNYTILTDEDRELLADAIISALLETDRRNRVRAKQARQLARLTASGGNSRIVHNGLKSHCKRHGCKPLPQSVIDDFRAFKARAEHRKELGFRVDTMY